MKMPKEVKSKRRYESPRRREQTAGTRKHILDVAQQLFEEHGYAGTTMSDIASRASVALKTLYLAFETKSGLLIALWYLRVRGDEKDIPVGARDAYLKILEERSPERKLRSLASYACAVKVRAAALMSVIRSAAPVDPDIQDLCSGIDVEFYANQRAIIESLHAIGTLRIGLDVTSATDILWTLNQPEVWNLLVAKRGWSAKKFEQWFGDTLCMQLLEPAAAS